ncbi:MAG: alpha/beta hydrolase [Chryseobacterium sp.]|uniref:alpha/beta hydrolase n=1 Tax=Chryseobacterium sp. TaxID=1871047 RepID=UPI00281EDB28|nr:alpha/beta hydrolase [Chryseobacterium sp.]MDR2236845.1 alpha/beta hydrolase [Chryseobacterium sp.]
MKNKVKFILSLMSFMLVFNCAPSPKKETAKNEEKNYIFFLHNKFLESNPSGAFATDYNTKVEYNGILDSYRKDGFIVISEKRKPKANVDLYARKVVSQIDSLMAKGVKANHITVVGTSKGGYIAQYVSTYAKNPDLNFVFIGCYQDSDLEEIPDINFCGNILTIYEKTDIFGVSALKRKERSTLPVPRFREIELNTGLKHGFLYVASDEWILPSKKWASRNYDFTHP